MTRVRFTFVAALAAVLAIAAGCAPVRVDPGGAAAVPVGSAELRSAALDRALEDRILALDPEDVSAADVRDTLAKAPAPRILLIHGGIFPVHLAMESFGRFLAAMGYPEHRIRDPGDGAWSLSPYGSAERVAGAIGWHYERDGVRPMMVGHSQGGIQAVKVLHTLAGTFGADLNPFDPRTGEYEPRTTIVDPLTGRERPVVGVSVSYVAVVGTGGVALALPNHWYVIPMVRAIPDTVGEFEGFRLALDLIAWDGPGMEPLKDFYATGNAVVKNITLPAGYLHVTVPVTADLAADPALRAWIEAWVPGRDLASAPPGADSASNLLFAADVWHGVKRHWVREAQRFVRARRALPPR